MDVRGPTYLDHYIIMKDTAHLPLYRRGWSDSAMVLGKLPVPGRPTIWIIVGQGPTALAIGAGGSCLGFFSLVYHFSFLTPSLSGRRPDID